ncbi:MAG: tRNA 2-thiouridine synthesizing protein C [Methanosaeta sp. NSM2]|jgi:tRNA 2-thiouridine synthesizing protein C|nr:DsrE family protein [Methanothrix sp.]OYV10871.1 MAG: tRNA 2-thiouridine synthesizing protein C [Methanosaeta sp. NSP1]OYV13597.1 MAG: tRNA 2-thiouridine synthesizing protein C [Methanosaeta sp. NSM2]OYV13686.1 MAG: tRNA 2-thiouridine synthesizing protein C [Methanosaeta sp. ASM2]MDD1731990.1 DsrE family protein [Methanothrix sp.]
MRSVFYLLDVAPYGSEKAYGVLNAAAVSIKMDVTLGLYADGAYLALAGQDSKSLAMPNLSDIIYAYPEVRLLAHEPSLIERGLMSQSLVERVELADEDIFMEQILAADCFIIL